ncbi:MAG: 50S ribosomal protein L11 methyltransferase [Deltaproteobacteria bacterium]|nr:50S ribosomal protein L11 methyltransferase [Deltaproteobacteria bacterium]
MSEAVRRFRIDCAEETTREWLLAEAFEAGAGGAEESEFDGRFRADIYADPEEIEAVRDAIAALGAPGTRVDPVETLPEVDWSEAWKEGLEALEISPRLLIRPPFVESPSLPEQREVVIEPGQAFGTGNHASTRLCLEWIDGMVSGEIEGPEVGRMLDVGTGSGVLALAAVALGVGQAIGFDLDPVAIEAAEEAARANPNGAAAEFFAGPIEAVSGPPFPLVVANLLKKEMLPIAGEIAARVAPGGRLVLAGLLEEDLPEVLARFGEEGLEEVGRLQHKDPIGLWVSPCLGRA